MVQEDIQPQHCLYIHATKYRDLLVIVTIDHSFQIVDHLVKGYVDIIPVRHAVAALIIADESKVLRQVGEKVPREGTFPILLQMGHPTAREQAVDPARPPIAVSHGGIGRLLRGLYGGFPRDEMLALKQPQNAFHLLRDGQVGRIDTDIGCLPDSSDLAEKPI